uniref:Uncharacterized protein n=1 Tax=Tanacetum cinerariifolium TaxID=118510 RepID=A0A6L2P5X9_TANCI|nr:hypothetical protein [Tanacetum cinerariifolium]
MLNQYESSPEFGNASGSGGCGDDEMADDEDGGKDEEDENDAIVRDVIYGVDGINVFIKNTCSLSSSVWLLASATVFCH